MADFCIDSIETSECTQLNNCRLLEEEWCTMNTVSHLDEDGPRLGYCAV
jgi:hypothetical protein